MGEGASAALGPKISVISACLNSEATIRHAITSVNNQAYSNVEHVFVDGGSSDGTLDIIEALSRRDKQLRSGPDAGIYNALNKGIALATGEIIGFLHSDDFYAHPNVLTAIAEQFADPTICGVYGDLDYVSQSDTGQVLRHWASRPFTRKRLRRGWMPPHPTLYVRKSWYERIGGFDTRYRIAADYDSILKLFNCPGFETRYLPEVLVKMRIGGVSNRSLRNILQKSSEDLAALRRSGVGGIPTLVAKNLRKVGQLL